MISESNRQDIYVYVPWGLGRVRFDAVVTDEGIGWIVIALSVSNDVQKKVFKAMSCHEGLLWVQYERNGSWVINGEIWSTMTITEGINNGIATALLHVKRNL